MSFVLEAVRDKPLGLWLLDGASPFTDYSGYNTGATCTSVVNGIALVNGATKSLTVSNSRVASFSSPVFKQNYESQPFAVEAWARSIQKVATDTPAEQQILGNNGRMDGITIRGSIVSFVTKYLTTGECRASFDLQVPRAVHVVGVHLLDRNQLFINGILVAEKSITELQRKDKYVVTDSNLYSGACADTAELAINGVGIYGNSLSDVQVKRHYNQGRQPKNEIVQLYSGVFTETSNANSSILFRNLWTTEFDWKAASLFHVSVQDERLLPEMRNGVSVKGNWRDSVDLYDASNPGLINSVNMSWDGEGAVVKASVDGTTWETVKRSTNLAIIPVGFNPTGKALFIEVSFPGNIIDDPSFMDNLTVVGLKSNVSKINDGISLEFTGAASRMNSYNPIELRNDWGVNFTDPGGYAKMAPDGTSDPITPRTIEVWFKVNDYTRDFQVLASADAAGAMLGNLTTTTRDKIIYSNATAYKNGTVIGASGTEPLKVGEWQVMHLVANGASGFANNVYLNRSALATAFELSGNIQVGMLVLYPTALTAQQVKDIVISYSGKPSVRANDSATLGIAETGSPVDIYAHDWTIYGAG